MTSSVPTARVSRWTRYGHDRLYVTAGDGTRLGWLDLKTGSQTIEVPGRADEFHAALATHPLAATDAAPVAARTESGPGMQAPLEAGRVAGGPVTADGPVAGPAANAPSAAAMADAVPAPASSTTPSAGVSDPGWVDLAGNRPGQAARAQAEQHRDAMRSRSRLLAAAARVLDVKTDERAWRTGADGEESIGARLERLTDRGWHVLHAVPVGTRGSDIDHVLIGPGGVYTINTKNHPGKAIWVSPTQIRVDGHPVPYLRNSRHEADRAQRLLTAAVGWDVPVKPVLVLLTGTVLPNVTIKSGGPTDVLILDRMDVPGAFKKAPARLSPDAVAAVFTVARRSNTWTN